MKQKYFYIIIGFVLAIGFTVNATPTLIFQRSIFPETHNTYLLGSSTRAWLSSYITNSSSTRATITTAWITSLAGTTTMNGSNICTAANGACPTGAPGGGITSLNGLSGDTQTFATTTSSSGDTGFNIISAGTAHTFYIPYASATNTGQLLSADWTTFNSKQATLTGISPIIVTSTSSIYMAQANA